MMRVDIDITVIEWLKKHSLLSDFNDALFILKSVMPEVQIDSIRYSESSFGHPVITCSVTYNDRTDFITKRKEFFDDIFARCGDISKCIKVVRTSRFTDETTVIEKPNGDI